MIQIICIRRRLEESLLSPPDQFQWRIVNVPKTDRSRLPLVYSCSGCSSAAQLANYLAVKLDRTNLAEMSCIAGVGGDVSPLVRTAKSGRSIISIDGCPLRCVQACLNRQDVRPSLPFTLSDYKVRKTFHEDFSSADATRILEEIKGALSRFTS